MPPRAAPAAHLRLTPRWPPAEAAPRQRHARALPQALYVLRAAARASGLWHVCSAQLQPPACHCSVLTPSTRRLRVSVCARCIMKRSRDESSGAQGGLLVRPSSVVSPGQLLCTPAAGAAAVRVGSGVQALGGALAAERGGALRRTKDGRLWVDSAVRRYVPCAGDPVVGVVAERHGETLLVRASAACAPARAPPARPLTPPPSLCPLHTRSTQRRGLGVQHMRACAGCAKGCQERGARGGHARSLARSLAGRQAGARLARSLTPRASLAPRRVRSMARTRSTSGAATGARSPRWRSRTPRGATGPRCAWATSCSRGWRAVRVERSTSQSSAAWTRRGSPVDTGRSKGVSPSGAQAHWRALSSGKRCAAAAHVDRTGQDSRAREKLQAAFKDS